MRTLLVEVPERDGTVVKVPSLQLDLLCYECCLRLTRSTTFLTTYYRNVLQSQQSADMHTPSQQQFSC